MPRKKGFTMTDEHKAALAEGRRQGRAVRDYLEALQADSASGRKANPEQLRKRIDETQKQIDDQSNPAEQVALIQKRLDHEAALERVEGAAELDELEKQFVKVAAGYGERKGITYAAWREFGVPAATLKNAGVSRSSS